MKKITQLEELVMYKEMEERRRREEQRQQPQQPYAEVYEYPPEEDKPKQQRGVVEFMQF